MKRWVHIIIEAESHKKLRKYQREHKLSSLSKAIDKLMGRKYEKV